MRPRVNVEQAREQLAAWNATAESGNDGDYDVWAEHARVSGWPEALDGWEAAEREASDLRERVAEMTDAQVHRHNRECSPSHEPGSWCLDCGAFRPVREFKSSGWSHIDADPDYTYLGDVRPLIDVLDLPTNTPPRRIVEAARAAVSTGEDKVTQIPKSGRAVGRTELLVSGQIPRARTHPAERHRDTFRCCTIVDPEPQVLGPCVYQPPSYRCGHTEHSIAAIERHVRTHGVGGIYETVT